ncbi:universal stress protein [Streptomyces sp. NPDC058469]|uniref:universal stress protein n=1 Tax=Streptomyces sp. NPDC058469 TaxID=3346514 RepID=UPI0036536D6E
MAQEARGSQTDELRLWLWRDKFPNAEVIEEAVVGQAGSHLADVAREASLLVIGHKPRVGPLGALVGPVTYAVLRATAVLAVVVPHD